MVGPLASAEGDLGAPTINVKNIDDGPPGRRCRRFRSTYHQHEETSTTSPLGDVGVVVPGAHTINAKKHQRRALRPLRGDPVSIWDPKGVL
jgi:hypothetical protein